MNVILNTDHGLNSIESAKILNYRKIDGKNHDVNEVLKNEAVHPHLR